MGGTMNAVGVHKRILTNLVKAIKAVKGDHLQIRMDSETWSVCTVDDSHTAMMEALIHKEDIGDTYEMTGDEMKISIPLDKLNSALDIIGSPDIDVTCDGSKLTLSAGGISRTMPLSGQFLEAKMPNFEMPCSVELDISTVAKVIRKSQDVGDVVEISIGPDGCTFSIMNEMETVRCHLDEPKSPTPDDYHGRYSIDYLTSALDAFDRSVMLEMGTDFPIRIMSLEPFVLKYVLAPIVPSQGVGE